MCGVEGKAGAQTYAVVHADRDKVPILPSLLMY